MQIVVLKDLVLLDNSVLDSHVFCSDTMSLILTAMFFNFMYK